MDEDARWKFLAELDDELLQSGVILSEWCSFIVRGANIAFARGASLAWILTAVSGIETYLRSEYSSTNRKRLADLIDIADLDPQLTDDLHSLRKYRNKWVHVDDPWDDTEILESPELYTEELENMARFAAKALRRTVYENQWI